MKSYRKSIWRTVRQSASRFMAIFAIVALGVGFLAGLLSATPDMRYSADRFFDETHLFDLRIVGTMGLTDEDIQAVQALDQVEEVMPAYTAEALVQTHGGDVLVARIQSIPTQRMEEKEPEQYINRLTVLEGRLPVKADECVLDRGSSLYSNPVEVGDTIIFPDPDQGGSSFHSTEMKVVGIVQSSAYFAMERDSATVGDGTLDLVLYTGEENFDLPVWTDLFVRIKDAQSYNSMEQAYQDLVEDIAQQVEDIGDERAPIRFAQVKEEAQTQLADARKEYEDAKKEADEKLEDAQQQLEDGRQQLEDGKKELEQAESKLESGQKELDRQKEQLPQTLTDAQNKVSQGEAQLIEARSQYEAGVKEVEAQQEALDEGRQQLEQAKQLVQVLEPVLQAAEQMLPRLEQTAQTQEETALAAEETAQSMEELAQQAQQTAQQERQNSQLPQLQEQYNQAQAAIDAARGEKTEEEWAQSDPAAPALIAARDAAKAAVQAEESRLNQLDAQAVAAQSAAETSRRSANQARQQADAAQEQVQQTKLQIEQTRQQLDQAKAQIAENEPKLEEGQKQLDQAKAQLEEARKQIVEGEKQLAEGKTQLSLAPELAKLQLDLAQEKLEDGQQQLTQGQQELADAEQELQKGEQEYATQKEDALAQLEDARQQLEDAQKQIDEMKEPEWYVLTRDQNVSVASLKANVEKVEAVAGVFPTFFFAVAALVALTTMTRMVEEERLQIGTMAALGYSRPAIAAKYVAYAMSATLAGCVVGLLVGLNLFPSVIWNAYSSMYYLPKMHCLFNPVVSAIAAGAAIACTLFATLSACWGSLMEVPAALMLPKAPKAGKRILLERITPVWKRMKFTHKVTARNLFRYKKRFFMTVIGIAGCTGLLVSGFGLHDSISDIVYTQYGSIFSYDGIIGVSDPEDVEDAAVQQVLTDGSLVQDWMAVSQQKGTVDLGDGKELSAYLFVPENEGQMSRFVTLRERTTGNKVDFSLDGVVITEKFSERAGLSVGDTLTIQDRDGNEGSFRVDGIAENYLENYVYLSADTYESQFGHAPEFTTLLVHLPQGEERSQQEIREDLASRLLELDGVSGVSFVEDVKVSFVSMLEKIDVIVVVLIVCAGLLAFVVLYNLTNINISERTKEIATIKVLGFFDNEVSAYVYRESLVLSVIGTLAGLLLGIVLHQFIIHSVEVDEVMFGRAVKAMSYVYSALLTLLFSFLVNLVMHHKLKNIDMVESMKAPE